MDIPIRPRHNPGGIHGHRVTRREFVDVPEKGGGRNGAPVGEYFIQAVDIDFSRDPWIREDRFDFGAEDKRFVCLRIEERPHAQTVAG